MSFDEIKVVSMKRFLDNGYASYSIPLNVPSGKVGAMSCQTPLRHCTGCGAVEDHFLN